MKVAYLRTSTRLEPRVFLAFVLKSLSAQTSFQRLAAAPKVKTRNCQSPPHNAIKPNESDYCADRTFEAQAADKALRA